MVEQDAIPPQRCRIPNDRPDIGGIVDTFDDDEPVTAFGQFGRRRSLRPVEQSDDGMQDTEPCDELADLVATDEGLTTALDETVGDRWDSRAVDQCSKRSTAGFQRPFDHQIALSQEQAGAGIVTLAATVGEPTFVEAKGGETLVV